MIDGRYSSQLELLDCATGTGVCGGITVWCPPNNNGVKTCTIHGDRSLYGDSGQPFKFYGINGFADFDFILTQSKLDDSYYGTMSCQSDYTTTCNISSFGFYCHVNGDQTCNDPNLYKEKLIYSFDFSGSQDWSLVDGSNGISWGNACDDFNSGLCVEMSHGSYYISRIISTIGYHSIHIQFDVATNSLESGDNDECYVDYRSSVLSTWVIGWRTSEDLQSFNESFYVTNNNSYNNQSSFELRFGVNANGGDHCRYSSLKVYGIQIIVYTDNPTQSPSTQEPSISPTTSTPSVGDEVDGGIEGELDGIIEGAEDEGDMDGSDVEGASVGYLEGCCVDGVDVVGDIDGS